MKIGVLKAQPNKWQAGIAWGRAPEWQHQRYWFIHIWCLKLVSLPKEGEMLRPEHYRGFRVFKQFFYPNVVLTMRTFRIGSHYFQIPIKIQFM